MDKVYTPDEMFRIALTIGGAIFALFIISFFLYWLFISRAKRLDAQDWDTEDEKWQQDPDGVPDETAVLSARSVRAAAAESPTRVIRIGDVAIPDPNPEPSAEPVAGAEKRSGRYVGRHSAKGLALAPEQRPVEGTSKGGTGRPGAEADEGSRVRPEVPAEARPAAAEVLAARGWSDIPSVRPVPLGGTVATIRHGHEPVSRQDSGTRRYGNGQDALIPLIDIKPAASAGAEDETTTHTRAFAATAPYGGTGPRRGLHLAASHGFVVPKSGPATQEIAVIPAVSAGLAVRPVRRPVRRSGRFGQRIVRRADPLNAAETNPDGSLKDPVADFDALIAACYAGAAA